MLKDLVRMFIFSMIVLSGICNFASSSSKERPKAPFKVLFSNDSTGTMCPSPYHKKGEPFRPEMLQASVDETAGTGVEVHLLQPGHGWEPFWQSKVYPIEKFYDYWQKRFPDKKIGNTFLDYIRDGGDFIKVFTARCREKGLVPFISYRLNDAHFIFQIRERRERKQISSEMIEGTSPLDVQGNAPSPFWLEHPEYRIFPEPGIRKSPFEMLFDWVHPEVREWKFAQIKEICENYDIDGFELDFMRFPFFFDLNKTTEEKRCRIMTDFVSKVRKVLDETATSGHYRWLSVRVPVYLKLQGEIGVNLKDMTKAGVDMVNLADGYYTTQSGDFAQIKKMLPDTAVYLEMHYTTRRNRTQEGDAYRRTTPIQYYTTAHLAYSRGLEGVSAFNFQYYREHGAAINGPFCEPPFEIFKYIGNSGWLAKQPQHYFLNDIVFSKSGTVVNKQLPQVIEPNDEKSFTLDMAPPKGGWKKNGKIRIEADKDLNDSQWMACINGTELISTNDVAEPYDNPYPVSLGKPEQYRAWIVPYEILKDGFNKIKIKMTKGQPSKIVFIDLAVK